jgi:hypothetical protein
MHTIEGFLGTWWYSTACTAIVIAHIERETEPLTGNSYITTSTIGQKLAPQLDKIPDDVVLAERELTEEKGQWKGRYLWNTVERNMTLKGRHLPLSNNLPADFRQIFRSK